MWCRNCKQDVPGVRGESFESIRCARCQQELTAARSGKSRLSQTPSSISFAEWQHGNLPDQFESIEELRRDIKGNAAAKPDNLRDANAARSGSAAEEIDDQQLKEFDAEIRRIDRIIDLWGEPRYLRFDAAHNGPHAKASTEKEKKKAVKPTAVVNRRDATRPNLFAVCLTLGGLLAITLGAAHAITKGEPELSQNTRIAAGFISAGALGIIAGLWYEVGRLKRAVNRLISGKAED
jgi:hypothetical protein